jgi:glycosyltransferase involved in cell wall biosynthesis
MYLNILFIVHAYKPSMRMGGPVESVASLAETLVSLGHHVTVVTTNSNLDEISKVPIDVPVMISGVKVYYYNAIKLNRFFPFLRPRTIKTGFLFCFKMKARLEFLMKNMDIVHIHQPYVYPGYIASKIASKYNVPVFYHQRGSFDNFNFRHNKLKKILYLNIIELAIMKRAKILFALTSYEYKSYRYLGVKNKCFIIPNGVSIPKPNEDYSREILSQYSFISSSNTVILFLGRISPYKGVPNLINAFLRVQKLLTNTILILAGPDADEIKKRYLSVISTLKLEKRIVFTGMVQGEEKSFLLSRCNLFCLPSFSEGFSMAILEAMAHGKPVLISPGCHFPEVVSANAGVICKNNSRDLSIALISLLQNKESLEEKGLNAIKLVKEKYNWLRISSDTLSLYYKNASLRKSNELSS